MKYGSMIKEARKSLGITQEKLATESFSRNLLSNIEMSRVNLVPAKALYLHQKLVEVAWGKSEYFELNFDELLDSYEVYHLIKDANKICYELHRCLTDQGLCSNTYVLEAIAFAKTNNVGLLRYYIYLFSARILALRSEKSDCLEAYFSALDYLKWLKSQDVLELFSDCLHECTTLGYELGEFSLLYDYYALLVDFTEEIGQEQNEKSFYNLALFSQKSGNYEASLRNIDRYLEYNDLIEKTDVVDAMILKAVSLTSKECLDEGLAIYDEVLKQYDPSEMIYQYTICLSNSIYIISKFDMKNLKAKLLLHINMLVELIAQNDIKPRNSTYSNIAQGYAYLKMYETADEYFKSGINLATKEKNVLQLVTLLSEAYKTFDYLEDYDYLLSIIISIDYEVVPKVVSEKFLMLLLKVQNGIFHTKKIKSDYKLFCNYTNQVIGGRS